MIPFPQGKARLRRAWLTFFTICILCSLWSASAVPLSPTRTGTGTIEIWKRADATEGTTVPSVDGVAEQAQASAASIRSPISRFRAKVQAARAAGAKFWSPLSSRFTRRPRPVTASSSEDDVDPIFSRDDPASRRGSTTLRSLLRRISIRYRSEDELPRRPMQTSSLTPDDHSVEASTSPAPQPDSPNLDSSRVSESQAGPSEIREVGRRGSFDSSSGSITDSEGSPRSPTGPLESVDISRQHLAGGPMASLSQSASASRADLSDGSSASDDFRRAYHDGGPMLGPSRDEITRGYASGSEIDDSRSALPSVRESGHAIEEIRSASSSDHNSGHESEEIRPATPSDHDGGHQGDEILSSSSSDREGGHASDEIRPATPSDHNDGHQGNEIRPAVPPETRSPPPVDPINPSKEFTIYKGELLDGEPDKLLQHERNQLIREKIKQLPIDDFKHPIFATFPDPTARDGQRRYGYFNARYADVTLEEVPYAPSIKWNVKQLEGPVQPKPLTAREAALAKVPYNPAVARSPPPAQDLYPPLGSERDLYTPSIPDSDSAGSGRTGPLAGLRTKWSEWKKQHLPTRTQIADWKDALAVGLDPRLERYHTTAGIPAVYANEEMVLSHTARRLAQERGNAIVFYNYLDPTQQYRVRYMGLRPFGVTIEPQQLAPESKFRVYKVPPEKAYPWPKSWRGSEEMSEDRRGPEPLPRQAVTGDYTDGLPERWTAKFRNAIRNKAQLVRDRARAGVNTAWNTVRKGISNSKQWFGPKQRPPRKITEHAVYETEPVAEQAGELPVANAGAGTGHTVISVGSSAPNTGEGSSTLARAVTEERSAMADHPVIEDHAMRFNKFHVGETSETRPSVITAGSSAPNTGEQPETFAHPVPAQQSQPLRQPIGAGHTVPVNDYYDGPRLGTRPSIILSGKSAPQIGEHAEETLGHRIGEVADEAGHSLETIASHFHA